MEAGGRGGGALNEKCGHERIDRIASSKKKIYTYIYTSEDWINQ